MKLLFAYFDYTVINDNPATRRPLGEIALNFSTTHNYSVRKEPSENRNDNACTYILSCSEKPSDECIPEGFWGAGIYNVTAIVGDNGAGKSTILHSIIRAVVGGLDPGVPFLIVLQKTDSTELFLYCSKSGSFIWSGSEFPVPEYPEFLMNSKSMLLDNTLSLSSIDLDSEYSELTEIYSNSQTMPTPYNAANKQLYNKSLVAGIRYSNGMSLSGMPKGNMSAPAALRAHFQYEAFQETRFIFSRFYDKFIRRLPKNSYPVTRPNFLRISVSPAEKLFIELARTNDVLSSNDEPIPEVCDTLQKLGLIGELLANAFLNLYSIATQTMREDFSPMKSLEEAYRNVVDYMPNDEASFSMQKKAVYISSWFIQKIINKLKGNKDLQKDSYKEFIKSFNYTIKFYNFISKNADTLCEIFEPLETYSHDSKKEIIPGQYIINVEKTIGDDKRRDCMISFLDKYRPIRDPLYFIVFSSGMSSGEKNMLRMLTQLWYMLDASEATGDKDEEGRVRNRFGYRNENQRVERQCDTLFLFLDEADLTYHPEWQRKFVFYLTTVLPAMFGTNTKAGKNDSDANTEDDPKTGKNVTVGNNNTDEHIKDIQVILATHSPLMLGDFPEASTIFLKKGVNDMIEVDHGERESSFGQNLYLLLKDGFFMDDSIGEFAKRKIKKVVDGCAEIKEHYSRAETLRNTYLQAKATLEKNEKDLLKALEKLKEAEKESESAKDNASKEKAKSDVITYSDKVVKYEETLVSNRGTLNKAYYEYCEHLKRIWVEQEGIAQKRAYASLWELYYDRNKDDKEGEYFTDWVNMLPAERFDEEEWLRENRKDLGRMYEIVRLLPSGMIKGKLISELEECSELLGGEDEDVLIRKLEDLDRQRKEIEIKLSRRRNNAEDK